MVPRGRGSWEALQKFNFKDLLLCSSLGKALAITAGMVAGPARILDQLRKTPFFEGASPAPPAGVATLGVGLSEGWYEQQYKRLAAKHDVLLQTHQPLTTPEITASLSGILLYQSQTGPIPQGESCIDYRF